jgi:hypothetical protein
MLLKRKYFVEKKCRHEGRMKRRITRAWFKSSGYRTSGQSKKNSPHHPDHGCSILLPPIEFYAASEKFTKLRCHRYYLYKRKRAAYMRLVMKPIGFAGRESGVDKRSIPIYFERA